MVFCGFLCFSFLTFILSYFSCFVSNSVGGVLVSKDFTIFLRVYVVFERTFKLCIHSCITVYVRRVYVCVCVCTDV